MRKWIVIALAFFYGNSTAQPTVSKVWVADNGNGTYKNPVLHADYSDPDAIRVGNDYYMISSSFNHVPGLPILHSKDLVNWTIIGHALSRQVPFEHFSKVQHGNGAWAPSIRYHNNEFYIYYPDPDFGIYLVKAKNIRGPWSEPVMVQEGKGLIDPCPFWDNDGKVYLVHAFANSRAGIKSMLIIKQLNNEGTKIIDTGQFVYDGHADDPTIEGPKFYKRNGYYFIFAPAGGVPIGWQTVLRSKNIYGPYERKVVMDQGATIINGPHQGAWVTTQTGEDWFLHFQDKEAYGRVVHLQPMKWVNDWPVIGDDKDGDGKGEPVITHKKPNIGKSFPVTTPQETDEFNNNKIGLQWQWQANPDTGWATLMGGSLKLNLYHLADSVRNLWNLPAILGQKLPAEEFIAGVKVKFSPQGQDESFGLMVLGSDYAYVSIIKNSLGTYIVCRKCINADKKNVESEVGRYPVKGNQFYLYVKMMKGGLYSLGYSDKTDRLTWLMETFQAKPGRWVGAKLGLFCIGNSVTTKTNYALIDWFRVEHL